MFNYDKITKAKYLEKTTIIQAIAFWMISVWLLSFLIGENAIVSPVFATLYIVYMFVKVSRDNKTIRENIPEHKSLSALANQLAPNSDIDPRVYLVKTQSGTQPLALKTISSFKRDSPIITTPSLIETFNDSELEAVIAHEVSHITNRHTSKLLVLSTLQLVMYMHVFIAAVGTILHILGFNFLFVTQVGSYEAMGITIGLIVLAFIYTVMSTTTRIYQEHIADAAAAAQIGDTLTYIDILETFADKVSIYDNELLEHRKNFLYKIDSLIYQNN